MNKASRLEYRATIRPDSATIHQSKLDESEAWSYDDDKGRPCLKAFAGSSAKAAINCYYTSTTRRDERLTNWLSAREAEIQRKKQQRIDANKPRDVEVDDVLRSSWGYDQTNIDYYQVIALIGKSMVELRQIAAINTQLGDMRGESVPDINNFIGQPFKKRCVGKSVSLNSFSSASLLEPISVDNGVKVYKPSAWTSYA